MFEPEPVDDREPEVRAIREAFEAEERKLDGWLGLLTILQVLALLLFAMFLLAKA